MGVQVLLIEDDHTIAEPLVEGLGHFGLTVQHVPNGTEGLRGPYGDVVLLDLGLPDIDGIDVCRGIRQVSEVPIIILSARGEEADRVLGLELGADDYLAKPFSMRELVARVRAVTRRSQRVSGGGEFGGDHGNETQEAYAAQPFGQREQQPFTQTERQPFGQSERQPYPPAPQPTPTPHPMSAPHPAYTPPSYTQQPYIPPQPSSPPPQQSGLAGPLVVDRRTRQVWVGEDTVILTPKEFDLLALLTEDPGAVYSRQQILDRVWDPHYQGPTKTLDVHVATLRRKLGNPAWIQTLRGVGFRLAVQTRPPTPEPAFPTANQYTGHGSYGSAADYHSDYDWTAAR